MTCEDYYVLYVWYLWKVHWDFPNTPTARNPSDPPIITQSPIAAIHRKLLENNAASQCFNVRTCKTKRSSWKLNCNSDELELKQKKRLPSEIHSPLNALDLYFHRHIQRENSRTVQPPCRHPKIINNIHTINTNSFRYVLGTIIKHLSRTWSRAILGRLTIHRRHADIITFRWDANERKPDSLRTIRVNAFIFGGCFCDHHIHSCKNCVAIGVCP